MAPPPSPPPRPPDPAVLIDELVEEFLLRLPPEEPELLARAALVSRQWYRVVTGPSFRRRLRELYRSTPPLLGYVLNLNDSIRFVPLLSFRPPRTHLGGVRAVSSSHGRVLLHRLFEDDLVPHRLFEENLSPRRCPADDVDVHLSMWHPITDEKQDLPVVPLRPKRTPNMACCYWNAAVVCAGGDGCDHLHCNFKVIFVGISHGSHDRSRFSCVYSSEAGSWSDPVLSSEEVKICFVWGNSVLIGTALYTMSGATDEILKYDFCTHQMCDISITPGPGVPADSIGYGYGTWLIAAEDGRLGFAKASNSTLVLWLTENEKLEESRAIDLQTLLPADAIPDPLPYEARPWVVAFAATGVGVIFLRTRAGAFTVDLKSLSCKKVGEAVSSGRVVPYVSFCTPAPAATVAISSDEVPVADIAVSIDEGPGAGVAVSADEGPGADGMCQVP